MPATRKEIYAAKTLAELQALEKKHGYAFGWAVRIYEARKNKQNKGSK